MSKKLFFIGLTFGFAQCAFPATYQRVACVDMRDEYKRIFSRLYDVEPGLDRIVYTAVERTGRKMGRPVTLPSGRVVYETDATNCVLELPMENGRLANGARRILFDYQWYENELGRNVFHQEGMRLEYHEAPTLAIDAVVMCRTPETCERLGIPFHRIP